MGSSVTNRGPHWLPNSRVHSWPRSCTIMLGAGMEMHSLLLCCTLLKSPELRMDSQSMPAASASRDFDSVVGRSETKEALSQSRARSRMKMPFLTTSFSR